MDKKILIYIGIFIGALTFIYGCRDKEPYIYKLDRLTDSGVNPSDSKPYIKEIYIIANPPKNEGELVDLINNFSDSIMKSDLLVEPIFLISLHFIKKLMN